MPKLTHEEAIKKYWEEIEEKYPMLDFKDVERMCRSPFNFIKECMRDETLPVIVIKFLGKIRVYSGRLKRLLAKNQDQFNRGIVNEEKYRGKKEFIEKHIKRIEADDKLANNREKN